MTQTGRRSFAFLLSLGLVASLALVSTWLHIGATGIGDKDWLLLAAGRWLGGQRLSVDVIEVNLPLILWLYALPVRLAQLFRLPEIVVLNALGAAAALSMTALGVRILRAHILFAGCAMRRVWLAGLLAALFVARIDPDAFADRDHLFLILTFPYFVSQMPSLADAPRRSALRLIVALCAAVGFAFKPHFMLVFAVGVLIQCGFARAWRPLWKRETMIIAASLAFYGALVLYATPDYVRIILPMALETYGAYAPASLNAASLVMALVTLTAAWAGWLWLGPLRRDLTYLLCLCLVLLAYALVGNGWIYTYSPLLSYGILSAAFAAWRLADARAGRMALAGCLLALGLHAFIIAAALLAGIHAAPDRAGSEVAPFTRMLRATHARNFAAFSPFFHLWLALSRDSGTAWDMRFNHLWMLPAFARRGVDFADAHQWILQDVAHRLTDLMDRDRPDLIFVDASPFFYTTDHPVDLVAYFTDDAGFRQAWSAYRKTDTINLCTPSGKAALSRNWGCRYDVYVRVDRDGAASEK